MPKKSGPIEDTLRLDVFRDVSDSFLRGVVGAWVVNMLRNQPRDLKMRMVDNGGGGRGGGGFVRNQFFLLNFPMIVFRTNYWLF